MKKRWIVGLLMSSSLCLLSGCGSSSQEESKDATPQSAESSSKDKEKKAIENNPVTIATPFNKNKPMYVTSLDDENMNVKAIITPYLDTNDKVKVELYEDGELEKTHIVDYKIEQVQKGSKEKLELYKYTFYENDSDESEQYEVTLMNATDLNEKFLWIYHLDDNQKELSDKQVRELIDNGYGSLMTDESEVVTMK